MKTFFIIDHRAKLPGNRLLSDLSIRAAALETGARALDLTFLERTPFAWLIDRLTRRGGGIWAMGAQKLLPPAHPLPKKYAERDRLYFFGWMFRNPAGLARHRALLLQQCGPGRRMRRAIDGILAPLQGRTLIGVHLKQRPFPGFENGEFLVPPARVREIAGEYLRERGLQEKDVALVEVSDLGPHRDDLLGLHLLSQCSVVIGTNSTFGNVAAWFGDVPHVVTTNEPIDWQYYRGKTAYFENKYATFAFGSLQSGSK